MTCSAGRARSGRRSISTASCGTKNTSPERRHISKLIPCKPACAKTSRIGDILRDGTTGRAGRPRSEAPTAETAMVLLLQQILAGLANGAIYATMALAVVMIYQ